MKKLKFSLSNIEGKLSRLEMKQILGGSGDSRPYEKCGCNYNIKMEDCDDGFRAYRNGGYECCAPTKNWCPCC